MGGVSRSGSALAVTDGIDGWIARRHGTTRSGAFLDPLADKVLVLGAMFALVAAGRFWWLPVLLIAVREVGISLFRARLGRRGLAVPARRWPRSRRRAGARRRLRAAAAHRRPRRWLGQRVLWVAVVLTLVTGAQYLLDGAAAATTHGSRPHDPTIGGRATAVSP